MSLFLVVLSKVCGAYWFGTIHLFSCPGHYQYWLPLSCSSIRVSFKQTGLLSGLGLYGIAQWSVHLPLPSSSIQFALSSLASVAGFAFDFSAFIYEPSIGGFAPAAGLSYCTIARIYTAHSRNVIPGKGRPDVSSGDVHGDLYVGLLYLPTHTHTLPGDDPVMCTLICLPANCCRNWQYPSGTSSLTVLTNPICLLCLVHAKLAVS